MISLLQRRWPAIFAALAAGAGAALAFPPFGFLPGILGYGLLMVLIDTASAERPLRSAFWRGWLAGAAFFLISTWWISEAFYVDAAAHGWQAPFAVGALAAGLGLFWGVAGLTYRALRPEGPTRALVFAGIFCLVEWVRGHVLTGFPWDLVGESWGAGSAPSQAASLIGAYGLSWITVAASAAAALVVGNDSRRARQGGLALAVLALAGLYGFGAQRLAHAAATSPTAPIVRVVQTNTREEAQYTDARFQQTVANYLRLTGQPAAHTPDIVVWPEGALPAALNDLLAPNAWTEVAIARALKPGQTLLTGGYRVAGPPETPIFYNSLMAARSVGGVLSVTATYDKHRLVPFGEYLPMAGVLKPLGLAKLVSVGDGFATGPAPKPIAPPGVPRVQPLICYEALFPGFTRAGAIAAGRAAWIVNVSDDAWFGATYGPLQHLNLARYRAIEEGLPMVRATPTGTSAVIDAYGRIAPGARLDHGAVGVIDRPLPRALPATLFDRIGDGGFWLMIALSVTAIIGRITKRRHNGSSEGLG